MEPAYITKTKGPCIILAGAGTGKTYSIVQKLKYLIQNKIYEPERIVCLTFSNEATNSLRDRILPILKDEREPIIRTFHSFCSDLIKKNGHKINLDSSFKILIPDDAKIIMHKNLKISPHLCETYVKEISIAKDLGITLESIESYLDKKQIKDINKISAELESKKFFFHTSHTQKGDFYGKKDLLKEEIAEIENKLNILKLVQAWKSYEKIKEKKNCLDYSDLNKYALELLIKNPQVLNEFDYIIVDEFQDTNKSQCDLLNLLAPHHNITVVGDLNQSIYRFRGAYKENISLFKKYMDVQDSDVFNLDKSYRSTNKILQAAHSLILNNYQNKNECFNVSSAYDRVGDKVKVYELNNNKEEVRKIGEIIQEELSKGVPMHEICVMFRTHQQTKALKSYLESIKMPYTSITKKNLFKIEEIKKIRDLLSILQKIAFKTKGGDSYWWDLFYNSDFDKRDLLILANFIKDNKDEKCISIKILNSSEGLDISQKGKLQLKVLLKIIKDLIPQVKKPITEIIKIIYEAIGINPENISEKKETVLVLQKFYNFAQEFAQNESNDLSNFLNHLEIIDILQIEIEAPTLNNSGIRIMTSHSTKGLEYDVVIMANLAQRKFPLERNYSSLIPSELSPEIAHELKSIPEKKKSEFVKDYEHNNQTLEERRLCYVSFTRAKSRLYITYAKEYNARKYPPSQFLHEINYTDNETIDFIQDTEDKFKDPFETKQDLEHQPIIGSIKNEKMVFSPSALQAFDECQKKYEYRYIYKMPDPAPISWDTIKLGSFVHKVLEEGVKNNFKELKQFIDLTKTTQMEESWSFVNLEEAMPLIKIFYERNKNKYNSDSLTEAWLSARIDGIEFHGRADRIDFTKNGLEIIDYKTGKTATKPRYRDWQLGFYAIASRRLGKPKKLTLETLQKETPVEFILDDWGNAREIHSARTSFNLNSVKDELVSTAKQIIHAVETSSFKPCPPEKNCNFCEEWVY